MPFSAPLPICSEKFTAFFEMPFYALNAKFWFGCWQNFSEPTIYKKLSEIPKNWRRLSMSNFFYCFFAEHPPKTKNVINLYFFFVLYICVARKLCYAQSLLSVRFAKSENRKLFIYFVLRFIHVNFTLFELLKELLSKYFTNVKIHFFV